MTVGDLRPTRPYIDHDEPAWREGQPGLTTGGGAFDLGGRPSGMMLGAIVVVVAVLAFVGWFIVYGESYNDQVSCQMDAVEQGLDPATC